MTFTATIEVLCGWCSTPLVEGLGHERYGTARWCYIFVIANGSPRAMVGVSPGAGYRLEPR